MKVRVKESFNLGDVRFVKGSIYECEVSNYTKEPYKIKRGNLQLLISNETFNKFERVNE